MLFCFLGTHAHTYFHIHTHLVVQAVLAEDRRGKVVVLGNIPGDEQFHLATSVSQYLSQVVICERMKSDYL